MIDISNPTSPFITSAFLSTALPAPGSLAATTLLEGVDWHPGFVVAPGTTETATIDGFTVATDTGDEGLPVVARMRLHDLDLTVVPLAHAPVLLEAADGRVSRFPRSLCRFDTTDGRRGYGWTEWNQLG